MTKASSTIRLTENDTVGVEVSCPPPVATALTASGLVRLTPTADGAWRLTPCGRVGAVRMSGMDVVVTPKVGISRLLFLLGYAHDPGFRPEDVQGTDENDLWSAVAETLCRHTERALARGVLQGYNAVEDDLRHVRGRILLGKQIARHPGMLVPVEVRYDTFTVDIPENRLLRTALKRMLATPRLPLALRARLRHFDVVLAAATPLTAGAPIPAWQATRLNHRYVPAMRIAELVLRYQSFEVGTGDLAVAAFVANMATVFENFIGSALREAWAYRPGRTRTQYPVSLDHDGTIRMKADVVHTVDGVPRIVADAKYKLESTTGQYPNADHYQMLAYCTALDLPTAWLVYAHGLHGVRTRRVRHTDVEIVEYPIDLSAAPSAVLDQIDKLAAAAWEAP
ncbi:5-methylcytosine restriction system specificity protein McrC [Amycolatopsis lurida]|uniref:5-methylcytosine restriction system specificity protein McrC n=1 Tax=Amycolatopsis lurida TaxID=31959 RepID=UPI00055981F7